jgi:hypothetical protein
MESIVAANQIISVPWRSRGLRERAWEYAGVATRRMNIEHSIAIATKVLGFTPQHLLDALKQITSEETEARGSFLSACQKARLARSASRTARRSRFRFWR